jgi:flavin-dependent dehydrogenase
MVMRDKFDHLMTSEAKKVGAAVMDNCAVVKLSVTNESVIVHTDQGDFRCKYLIGADGAYSTTARLAGIEDNRTLIPALEYELSVPPLTFDCFENSVRFDVGVIPYGYGWIFPKKNHLSAGVGHLKQSKIKIKNYYKKYIKRLSIEEIISEEQHGYQIPISPRKIYGKGRVILAGDAAGLADPVVAEGISNALLSGKLAAEAVIKAINNNVPIQKYYTKSIKKSITRFYVHSLVAAKLFYDCPKFSAWVFKKRGQILCEWFTEVFMGSHMYPGNLFRYGRSILKLIKN